MALEPKFDPWKTRYEASTHVGGGTSEIEYEIESQEEITPMITVSQNSVVRVNGNTLTWIDGKSGNAWLRISMSAQGQNVVYAVYLTQRAG